MSNPSKTATVEIPTTYTPEQETQVRELLKKEYFFINFTIVRAETRYPDVTELMAPEGSLGTVPGDDLHGPRAIMAGIQRELQTLHRKFQKEG